MAIGFIPFSSGTIKLPPLRVGTTVFYGIPKSDAGPRVPPHKGDVWLYSGQEYTFRGELNQDGNPLIESLNPKSYFRIETLSDGSLTFVRRGTDAPPKPTKHLPHKCTRCSSPSFNMTLSVECSNSSCVCYKP